MNFVRLSTTAVVAWALLLGCDTKKTTEKESGVATNTTANDVQGSGQSAVANDLRGTVTDGTKLFRRLAAAESGIDLVHSFPKHADFNMLSDQSSGSGVCVGDIDNDGLPDVYVTNFDQGNRLASCYSIWFA